MKYSIAEINKIVNGKFLQEKEDTVLTQVCIDTRQITNASC
jgi:UDP-N-acetylmuramyl pentapeptide synthase